MTRPGSYILDIADRIVSPRMATRHLQQQLHRASRRTSSAVSDLSRERRRRTRPSTRRRNHRTHSGERATSRGRESTHASPILVLYSCVGQTVDGSCNRSPVDASVEKLPIMELPWFDGLDDATLEAALRGLEGYDENGGSAVHVSDTPPFAWLNCMAKTDVTVSVNPQAPLQVELRFGTGECDLSHTRSREHARGSSSDECDVTSARGCEAEPALAKSRGSRKRQEMQSLREEVDALESTLSELTHLQRTDTVQLSQRSTDKAWERVASRQRSQLRRSQAQNRKLRDGVDDHNRMVDQLQRLIQLHEERVRARRLSGVYPAPLLTEITTTAQETAMLDSLTDVLTPMHHRTDAVLADPRLSLFASHFSDINVECGPDSLAIQCVTSRVLPFDFKTTSNAVWRNLLNRLGSHRRFTVEDELPLQTHRAHFVSYMRAAGFDGYTTCYMALQRTVEPDRIIFLRSAVFIYIDDEVVDTNTSKAEVKRVVRRGSPVRHFLWTTVSRPHPTELQDTSDPTQLTQVQMCGISLPNVVGQNEAEIAVTTTFYSEMSKQMHLQTQEEVDNLLLETSARDQFTPYHGAVAVASC